MSQLFISHAEEDATTAAEIGEALERRGFSVWYYGRDSVPGPHYLEQVRDAIGRCAGVVLIISPSSMASPQVGIEVIRAFESGKSFVPVLSGLSHAEFQHGMPYWGMVLGTATSVAIPPAGVSAIIERLEKGVRSLGVVPQPGPPPPEAPAVQTPSGAAARRVESAQAGPREPVECALFGPRGCDAGDTVLFQVWLHNPEQSDEVILTAEEADEDARLRARGAVRGGLVRGTRLGLRLEAGEFPIDSPTAHLMWRGEAEVAQFAVTVPEGSPRYDQVGEVTIFEGEDAQARLKFTLRVKGAKPPADEARVPQLPQSFVRYRRAYLCYASADRDEVLRRAQLLSSMGISMSFSDPSLKPGGDWREETYRLIREADLFLLFWSEAASRSQFVRKEVNYALELKGGSDSDNPPHIMPVILSTPAPPPPPELASLHFNDTMAYLLTPAAKK